MGEAVQNPGRNGSDGDDDAEIDNKTSSDNRLGKVLQNELLIESKRANCAWGK